MKKLILGLIATFTLISCNQSSEQEIKGKTQGVLNGSWLGELSLNDSITLSFIYNIANEPGRNRTYIKNGEEEIFLETTYKGDSVFMDFPVYQSRLVAIQDEGIMMGYFEKTDAANYRIPFIGNQGFEDRYPNQQAATTTLHSSYAVSFNFNGRSIPAIGEFNQNGNKITGSFLTETGDYRFLEGKLNGNNLTLFGFDGGYIQVFKATIAKDSILNGHYYSGLTGYRTFTGYASDTFVLSDPENMSSLRPDLDSISFTYPGISGNPVSYNPNAYKNKVVILQITGSWCPNCKDQGKFLQGLSDNYGDDKVVVMGIAFERMGTLEKSIAAAKKSKDDLGLSYPVGIAKYERKQVAEEVFPVLEKIKSYPTLIIIDKQGTVRKIYTGFAGPGTSKFQEVTTMLKGFVNTLVNE